MLIPTPKKMRQQFADSILEIGQEDEKLIVLIGDISHFILQPFARACQGRFFNVGICEPTIVSMGAGLSRVGFYPVLHTISPFLLERSFEQIKLDFCYQGLGGNLVTVGSAFDYANLGCTHHCYNDWALMKFLSGTEIVYPASPIEFEVLFRHCYKNNRLTLFRLPEYQHEYLFRPTDIQFGKPIKIRSGAGLTIVTTGPHLKNALESVDRLMAMEMDPEIFYIHTIHPLDVESIKISLMKTRKLIVLEEHVYTGGVGEEILKSAWKIPELEFFWIGIPNQFIREYSSYREHCEKLGLSSENILNIASSFSRKRNRLVMP